MSNKNLLQYLDSILETFIDKYLYYDTLQTGLDIEEFQKCFSKIINSFIFENEEDLKKYSSNLATVHIENHISYIVLINQLNDLKNTIVNILVENKELEKIARLFKLYMVVEQIIAEKYLQEYIKKTFSINNIRLASLNDMVQKELVGYYEDHLIWLDKLMKSVQNLQPDQLPELSPELCNFGKWLNGDEAKTTIKNNSKHKNLIKIHNDLHKIAILINKQFLKENLSFNILMNYLEQCESISLAIGTELALIDNTIIIKKASKDVLTSALSRGSLENIFTNQYEIALATDTSFSLAMLDLDNFKFVNDNYGHIIGDEFLKAFVQITMKTLRKSDIIVRYGGEEFVIFLPNTNKQVALQKLNEVRENFAKYINTSSQKPVQTTVSMGLVVIEPKVFIAKNELHVKDYIQWADKYLYDAKRTGKNKIVYGEIDL